LKGPVRFTIVGAFGGAVEAARRAPAALGLLLLANIAVTAFLAWLYAAALSGAGLAPWLGRMANNFAFVLVDATLGTLVLAIAVAVLAGRPADLGEAGRRVRLAFPVVLPLTLLSAAVRMVADATVYQPISGEGMGDLFYGLVRLLETLVAIAVACTIGMASFTAVADGPRGAWGRGFSLIRKARWRLVVITLILAFSGEWASDLGGVAASLAVPGEDPGPLWDAVSQTVYTTWYLATVLLYAGAGHMLARVHETRDADQLADAFS
jgi:hypothetical protein